MGGKSSQSTQTVSIPPEVLARYNAVNARAESAASNPFQQYSSDPNAFVAPLNSTQQSGIYNTNAAAGMAQPYYGAATGAAFAGAQAVNPGQLDVQQYMNPYLGTVVGNTANLLNQENQQAMSGQTGNAIQQGAFGGDRAGVAAANLSRQQNMAFGNTIGGLLQQGYGQALGTAQQQQGVQLGAEQANRQALQQLASSLAGLGAGAQTAGLQGAQAQLAAGQVQQGTEQAGKTALYNQFLQQMSYPYQQAQFLANIAEGTGALSGSTTTGTASISDRRAKHDVHEIGRTFDGQPIYNFKYNGDDRTQIGLMAQDVEKRHPEAVGLAGGLKTVDYGKATHEAAHRGHFASGGLAGSSEGGMVHMGHVGEGYAGGGMIDPMGYGSSPFVGYDPTAAFQSLYGGLLGLGGAGGGAGGVGGIGIPTGATSHGELAVAKMEQPQMPSMVDQADKWASLGKNVYGLGKEVGAWGKDKPTPADLRATHAREIDAASSNGSIAPSWNGSIDVGPMPDFSHANNDSADAFTSNGTEAAARGGLVGGMRHSYAEGGIPYSGAAESIIPDEKPDEHKLLQADPSSMPKPSGGGISGILGGLGSLASFIPGVGGVLSKGLGAAGQISGGLGYADGGAIGYADGGEVEDDDDDDDALLNHSLREQMAMAHRHLIGDDEEAMEPKRAPDEAPHDAGMMAPSAGLAPKGVLSLAPPSHGLMPAKDGLFQKIMHGEGTDKFSNPYDVVYGANPRSGLSPYANPEGRLSSMPIGAVQDFQRKLIAATRGKVRGLNPNEGTGAVGAYQFTRDTLANLAERLYGPDWKSIPFSPEVQDQLASELARERNGHLEGAWAAFRDEGPAGARLRAQAGYASGGLAGRKGYAGIDGDSAVTGEPENLLPEYMQDTSTDQLDQIVSRAKARGYVTPEEQAQMYRAAPNQTARDNLVALQQKAGLNTVANEPEQTPQRASNPSYVDQDAGDGEAHHRGFLGDILHGKFISGLGKGDADSWIPLLSGIGASMSGPYRGIVGLGQGLAAGAKTAQGIREFDLKQYMADTERANVLRSYIGRNQSAAAYGLPGAPSAQSIEENRRELQRLFAIHPNLRQAGDDKILQGAGAQPAPAMTGTSRDDVVNAINDSKSLTQNASDYSKALKIERALEPVKNDPTVAGFYNRAKQVVDNFTPPPESNMVRLEDGSIVPRTSLPGNTGAPQGGVGGGSTQSGGLGENVPQGGTSAGARYRRNQTSATAQAAPVSPYGPDAFLPKPPMTPNLSPDYDINVLRQRMAGHLPGDPVFDSNQRMIDGILGGQISPLNRDNTVNNELWNYYRNRPAMEAEGRKQQGIASGYRGFASNAGAYWDKIENDTRNLLSQGKLYDISGTGALTSNISKELGSLGITDAARYNARDAASYNMAAGAETTALLHNSGIPESVPVESGSSATAIYNNTIMRRAAAKMAADKAADFNKHDTLLRSSGQPFTGINQFNQDWNGSHRLRDYIRTEIHQNGFIRGMSSQDMMGYASYLPSISIGSGNRAIDPSQPRGAEKGYYRMGNGIVKVRDGKVVGFVARGG